MALLARLCNVCTYFAFLYNRAGRYISTALQCMCTISGFICLIALYKPMAPFNESPFEEPMSVWFTIGDNVSR